MMDKKNNGKLLCKAHISEIKVCGRDKAFWYEYREARTVKRFLRKTKVIEAGFVDLERCADKDVVIPVSQMKGKEKGRNLMVIDNTVYLSHALIYTTSSSKVHIECFDNVVELLRRQDFVLNLPSTDFFELK